MTQILYSFSIKSSYVCYMCNTIYYRCFQISSLISVHCITQNSSLSKRGKKKSNWKCRTSRTPRWADHREQQVNSLWCVPFSLKRLHFAQQQGSYKVNPLTWLMREAILPISCCANKPQVQANQQSWIMFLLPGLQWSDCLTLHRDGRILRLITSAVTL